MTPKPFGNQKAPQNSGAERWLLGAILLDPQVLPLVATLLEPDDFFSLKHGDIWRAMLQLFEQGKPIDITTLAPFMVNEDASSSYLAGLMQETPHALSVESHAEQIKGESRRRAVLTAARQIVSSVYEERDPSLVETKAKEILLGAIGSADTGQHLISPSALGRLARDYFTNKAKGELSVVPTGYATLDNLLGGGLRRGDLITLAARTSVGKSSFAENIAEHIARNQGTVLFVSIEMTPEQLIHRYAVRNGSLSKSAIEYGADDPGDLTALDNLAMEMATNGLHILNAPSATTTAVRSAISRMQMQSGPLSLVVIDYLQLLKDRTREEERLNIGAITSTLKMMAREFHVPVLLLSQLNRQIEYRGGEPHLSDLRESGRIEEDSDVVVLLWRMDKEDSLGNLVKGKIEKNRQGPTGELPISFNASSFRFSEKYQAAASNNGVAEDDLIPIEDSLAGIYHKNEAERVAVDG